MESGIGSEPYEEDRLETLRENIKRDRDRHFVKETYDLLGITSVPKSFWARHYEQGEATADLDYFSRKAVEGTD